MPLTTKVISDMECRGVYTAHVCHLCQFVGHYLSLQVQGTLSIQVLYYRKGIFYLNLSIITDILGWKSYHRSFFFENSSINSEFANNRIREITAGAYLVCITETVNNCQQLGTGALLVISYYIFRFTLGKLVFFSI